MESTSFRKRLICYRLKKRNSMDTMLPTRCLGYLADRQGIAFIHEVDATGLLQFVEQAFLDRIGRGVVSAACRARPYVYVCRLGGIRARSLVAE